MLTYPFTRRDDQVDDFHGTPVADPYRWLENVDSPETQAWIQAQNALTFEYLSSIPARDAITRRMTELWDYPKQSAPFERGGRYFQFRNSGLQSQAVLYRMDSPRAPGHVLLDPNILAADGTLALNSIALSHDGALLAYATSASGSDWQTWRVREVDSRVDRPDLLEWSKFGTAAWRRDGAGFYYTRYAAPTGGALANVNFDQKLYWHRLGTPQSDDTLVYARPDHKDWLFQPRTTNDGRYLLLEVSEGTDSRNRVFYFDLPDAVHCIELIPELEASYEFVGSEGPRFYFRTDQDAAHGRFVAIDVTQPERAHWHSLIPESDDILEQVVLTQQHFAAVTLHHAQHRLELFDRTGRRLREIALPAGSALLSVNGHADSDELFVSYHAFLRAPTNLRYDLATGRDETLESPAVEFDASRYETRQVFAVSRDDTRVPMFITQRKGLPLDGRQPVLLYGYGGFDIALTPSFDVSRLVWLEMGGVFAMANLRGGGEYGEEWHRGGMLHAKQNVFDDFIACAEHLISEGITSSAKLAIQGRSNGGLLVGACLTQRPELFGAALPAVGVMDMLRFHRFTIGWAWVSDYGSAENPEEFRTLYAYSPLHNLRPGTHYPPTLIYTADHDDRVVPGHSFKFAAALQAAQGGPAPILIRVDAKAGHGMGKPTAALIQEQADNLAFLARALDMQPALKAGG